MKRSHVYRHRRGGPVGAVLLTLVLLTGCMAPPKATWGTGAIFSQLESTPAPGCGRAAELAQFLHDWARNRKLQPGEVDRIVALLKAGALCEKARINLVVALRLAEQRDRLPDLIECLNGVGAQESALADELAALIVDFSDTSEEVFSLVRAHIASPHVTLRYGCVDLLDRHFAPDQAPAFGAEIIDLLSARVREEQDPAVAELACKALGEIGVAQRAARPDILQRLQDVSNDQARVYANQSQRRTVPRRSAEDVRAMAVAYDIRLRE